MTNKNVMLQEGKNALIIAPYYDPPTGTSSIAARSVIDYLLGEGMNVTLMEGDNATYDVLRENMADTAYDVIYYAGHGTSETWIGQAPYSDTSLLSIEDAYLLSGSMVVSISCSTLRRLGTRAVIEKADGYFGFEDVVYAPVAERVDRNYRADFIRTFMRPLVSLVEGKSLYDAVVDYKALCKAYGDMYVENRWEFSEFYTYCMTYNGAICSYAGNPKGTL
jgi:hypothetical protein